MHLLCFQFQSNSTVEPILPSFITNFPPPQGETWLPLPSTYLLTYSDPENTESTFKIAHLQWKANLLITRIKYLLTVFFFKCIHHFQLVCFVFWENYVSRGGGVQWKAQSWGFGVGPLSPADPHDHGQVTLLLTMGLFIRIGQKKVLS